MENTKEMLKLLIITPEGEIDKIYVEDYPDIQKEDKYKHSIYLDKYLHKICKNRNLRKEAHPKDYFGRLKTLQKYNYTVLLDTTNYLNYHSGKKHEGLISLPSVMSNETKEVLKLLYPFFEPYHYQIPVGYLNLDKTELETKEFKDVTNYLELLETFEKEISKKSY